MGDHAGRPGAALFVPFEKQRKREDAIKETDESWRTPLTKAGQKALQKENYESKAVQRDNGKVTSRQKKPIPKGDDDGHDGHEEVRRHVGRLWASGRKQRGRTNRKLPGERGGGVLDR